MIKTKSGARKIEGTDNWREIFEDHNYTVDALDQLAEDMAIIVNGNKTAYASGAAVGQYVLLRTSTITDRADGMYKAAKAIPYNTTIDKTYLTAVSGGAINSLSDQIATEQNSSVHIPLQFQVNANSTVTLSFTTSWAYSFLLATTYTDITAANGYLFFVNGYVSASRGVASKLCGGTYISIDMSLDAKSIRIANTGSNVVKMSVIPFTNDLTFSVS